MWHTGKKEGKEEIRSNRRVIKYISTYVHGKKQGGGERGAEEERGEREKSCITSGYILIDQQTDCGKWYISFKFSFFFVLILRRGVVYVCDDDDITYNL